MKIIFALTLFLPSLAWSHARLISPVPRNNNAGIKTGPCGGLARGTPLTLTAGANLTVQWEETIQHPGRYYISFSPANDQGFENNRLATIIDTQDTPVTGPTHKYSTNIVVPNVPCETCTLQLIQSMEENPQAPTFYYSCADIRIVSASTGGGNSSQGSSAAQNPTSKVGGGCGTVSQQAASPQNPTANGALFLVLPFLVGSTLNLIAHRQSPKTRL